VVKPDASASSPRLDVRQYERADRPPSAIGAIGAMRDSGARQGKNVTLYPFEMLT
jgi:hypothetical protein